MIIMTENEIGKIVINASIKIHKALGPGLLESVYEIVLAYELTKCGLQISRQVPIAINYCNITLDEGFRADIIVENSVILELKAVENIMPVHKKQLQIYLKLTGCKLGYLLNFNEELMKYGITRCVNHLEE